MRWLMACILFLAAFTTRADIVALAETDAGMLEGRGEDGVSVFRGIPYAAPPVGGQRWRAPQAVVPWKGSRSAARFGDACVQDPQLSTANGGDPGRVSEDCLYLNVWTPLKKGVRNRPVLVWIHGGALVFGSGAVPLYDGSALAREGIVVVTINYRMGALGFFAHPTVTGQNGPVNFGLLDQIAALQWVQRNIAAFGGDPRQVTIAGQSAGAQSVLALMVSPKAKGLFQRAIAQSPYGVPSHTRSKAQSVSYAVADALGLPGKNAAAAQLRAIPADRFAALKSAEVSLAPSFIVGDEAVPRTILQSFQQDRQARVPLIVGSTDDDGSVLVAFGVNPAALVQKLQGAKIALKLSYPDAKDDAQLGREIGRDLAFTAFVRRIAYLQSQRAPTWRYWFSYLAQNQRSGAAGVPHGGEIAYVFGTGDSCRCLDKPFVDKDRERSREVQQRWLAFIRGGPPDGGTLPIWPRDSARRANVLDIGDTSEARPGFMAARLNTFIALLQNAERWLGR
ncbi:carboxylesterase/lipase family protein [Arenimonas sp.]|uniref:carboxylesterase/lipase family protein n=1 Tax=Arenimonas sp. TaxID=1872635 RepID=UPI0039E667F8